VLNELAQKKLGTSSAHVDKRAQPRHENKHDKKKQRQKDNNA
jgi:hypothetical protein